MGVIDRYGHLMREVSAVLTENFELGAGVERVRVEFDLNYGNRYYVDVHVQDASGEWHEAPAHRAASLIGRTWELANAVNMVHEEARMAREGGPRLVTSRNPRTHQERQVLRLEFERWD
jgi:hypothetical protein